MRALPASMPPDLLAFCDKVRSLLLTVLPAKRQIRDTWLLDRRLSACPFQQTSSYL